MLCWKSFFFLVRPGKKQRRPPTGSREFPARALALRAQTGNEAPFFLRETPPAKRPVRCSYKWDPNVKIRNPVPVFLCVFVINELP
jgi:hypothetical protein